MAKTPRQNTFEGMGVGDPAIDDQIAKVYDITLQRLALGKTEEAEREKLIALLKEHGYKVGQVYKHGGIQAELARQDPAIKVRVRVKADDGEESDPDKPIGEGTMALPGEESPNRPLETGRKKMAAARAKKS